ncbi:MAG: hypothetical protein ACFFCW_22900 [Candidatus Hodarchaeota archaeon]
MSDFYEDCRKRKDKRNSVGIEIDVEILDNGYYLMIKGSHGLSNADADRKEIAKDRKELCLRLIDYFEKKMDYVEE